MPPQWMIYGATGYTGQLLAEHAVQRGHKPVLAGRAEGKLRPLAERLGLDWLAVSLEDEAALHHAVRQVNLVFHAAGPYADTAQPMLDACVAGITNYIDIAGDTDTFALTFGYDQRAYDREVAFVTGCGFDVVPSDCLANHVAAQVENPAALVLAIDAPAQMSPGTAKTMVNFLAGGGMVRREGRLEAQPFGAVVQRFCFPHGEKLAASVPWGDLESAYRSTGIPNITTFLALPRPLARLARYATPALKTLLQHAGTRRWMQHTMGRLYSGPSEHARQTARCAIYAWAENRHGQSAEAWLTTVEAYHFTALAGIRCVERVLADHPRGVLTPAQAFGADFVLEIDGTARQDSPHG